MKDVLDEWLIITLIRIQPGKEEVAADYIVPSPQMVIVGNNCGGTCQGGCRTACTTGCKGGCKAGCSGGCVPSCKNACKGSCKGRTR
jgi:hypothetical protein